MDVVNLSLSLSVTSEREGHSTLATFVRLGDYWVRLKIIVMVLYALLFREAAAHVAAEESNGDCARFWATSEIKFFTPLDKRWVSSQTTTFAWAEEVHHAHTMLTTACCQCCERQCLQMHRACKCLS